MTHTELTRRQSEPEVSLTLTEQDRAMLEGAQGPAAAMAMRLVSGFARALGAERLLDISRAHVDGCMHHGQVSLDFVERLVAGGGKVRVPTTLNVGSIDLIHPDLVDLGGERQSEAARIMEAHQELGCLPSFTCAPYQTLARPRFGEQVAWGESNAIVFANSVIGARTNRYGDFIDLACALTGRAPAWGLHLDANRRGRVLYRLTGFPASQSPTDSLYAGVGLIVGADAGSAVPVIEGLPPPRDEDQLKALGAAAASAGAVALFHAVGITPEAQTASDAFHGGQPDRVVAVTKADVTRAVARLSAVQDGTPIAAVCLGTPHFSRAEWERLLPLLRDTPRRDVPIYVNTGRETLQGLEADGLLEGIEGLVPVADTCTYITAVLRRLEGAVMTNSAKWAHYAPGDIGATVAFGELEDCIASAAAGRVVRGGQ